MFLHVCLCVYFCVCVCVSVSADVAEWMMNRSVHLCDGAHGEESGETPSLNTHSSSLKIFKRNVADCHSQPQQKGMYSFP